MESGSIALLEYQRIPTQCNRVNLSVITPRPGKQPGAASKKAFQRNSFSPNKSWEHGVGIS